jgi:LacI family transcriptional regulator
MNNRRTTIAQVAERAGVITTTVSHVLSGNRPVASRTEERVRRAIEELGYRPSGLARSLRLRRSDTVALIVPDIANPFYPVFARGVHEALDGRYLIFLCDSDASRERELRYAMDLRDRNVDGMVIAPFGMLDADLDELLGPELPAVALGDRLHHPRLDAVLTDDEHGAWTAVRHLLDRGRRRIAHIRGAEGAGELRAAGYRRALDEAGIEHRPGLVADGGWHRAGGAEAMRRLLDADERPDAVFAANDLMAIGALDAIRGAGLFVPDDIALVGYDDIEAAALARPPLTTVLNPGHEAGLAAGRLLRDRMTGDYDGEPRTVTLPSSLVVRESS